MAILTKFLKLLKPEKNDYVDVEKHLSENYDKIDTKMEELSNSNDEKLNKGAVSSDYDTAKKIEDKIKDAQNTADNKLDKSGYNGTAQTLKNSIDGKVSKTGDTMTGPLAIKTGAWSEIQFNDGDNKRIGTVGSDISLKKTFLHAYETQSGIDVYTDGRVDIFAKNLNTSNKEVIAAINELNNEVDKKYDKTGGAISGNVVVTGNEVVNGSISCNSIILNGYTITIE